MNWQIGHKQRYLLFAALAVMVWILLPAQAARADCGGTNPTVLCVDADANGTPDGLSWTNAYTNVRDAISVTHAYSTTNYEIWVAEGVYYPDEGVGTIANSEMMSFTLGYNNVQLYGGFAGIESARDQRDWAANVTILSGDLEQNDIPVGGVVTHTDNISGTNAYHVLWLDGVSNENITATTVIDGFTITAGQADGSDPHDDGGGLYCVGNDSGNECSPALANVIFSGNQATSGGGMYNYGHSGVSSPALSNVTFSGNRATYGGGGMFNYGRYGVSSPALINVTFSGNQADISGGGMSNYGRSGVSSPALTNVTFSGNQAPWGGGMISYGGHSGVSSPVLTNVTFSGNQATNGGGMVNDSFMGDSSPVLNSVIFSSNQADIGGGIFNYGREGAGSPVLTNVTFSGNWAYYGGGMYNDGQDGVSSPALTNVTFSGNWATTRGGGMYNNGYDGISSPALTNVIFSGNQAPNGGGMFNSGWGGVSNPVLTNVTFSGNQATFGGGGMYSDGHNGGNSSPALTNVILWGNTASTGNQLYNEDATPVLSYTLVQSGTNDIYNTGNTSVTYGAGILTGDPLFTAPITATAAPTTTGDYHLQAASPAIDAGDNDAGGLGGITTDLDGNPRFADMPIADTGNGSAPFVDMGAYEAQGLLYVDADASGSANGLSWTDAFTNVQDALAVTTIISTTDYEIWVAEGVYYPDEGAGTIADSKMMSFTLRYNNVQLYGGFAGVETAREQRDWAAHVTILSGDLQQDDTTVGGVVTDTGNISGTNAYHVLYLDGVTNETITAATIIDGFTLTAGQANSSDPHDRGGGLYCAGNGGGNECSPTLSNVTFSGNQAADNGGGMCNFGYDGGVSSPALSNVTFSGNRSGQGGGMSNLGEYGVSSPALTNVTFSGNQAGAGGGMLNNGEYGVSSPVLTNVTFSGNQAYYGGGGMYNDADGGVSSPALTNVILWGNTADSGNQLYNKDATPILSYTLIQSRTNDIYNTGSTTVTYGAGILTRDPLFAAPIPATAAPTTGGDYRLQACSPAIDAGDDSVVTAATDLDGNPRILGSAVDMGAYEAAVSNVPCLSIVKTVTPTVDVAYHGTATYTVILGNGGALSDTNVFFSDTLPGEVVFSSWVVSPENTLRNDDEITWSGTLTAGTALTWTFRATHIGNYADSVVNTAEFIGTLQAGEDDVVFVVVGQPEITVAPLSLAFSDQDVDAGATVSQTVTITNDGSADLHISSINTAGDTGEFNLADSGQATLTPGSTRAITVSFDPSSVGAKAVTLTIQSDDGDEASVDVALSGTGTVSNSPPVADAGGNQSVATGATVTLDGSGSYDPDGDLPLAYRWAQTGGPAVAFTPNLSITTFTAPSSATVLTFTLVVTDTHAGTLGLPSVPDTVVITVTGDAVNIAPVAKAGLDQSVAPGETVTLNGSGSYDIDGHLPLTYSWAQTGGPGVTFIPGLRITTFSAPTSTTVFTFTLTVTDALGLSSAPDTVVITVSKDSFFVYLPSVLK